MNVLERFLGFWKPRPADDHPLTDEERLEDRPARTYDELARSATEFVGSDFDPDDHRARDRRDQHHRVREVPPC